MILKIWRNDSRTSFFFLLILAIASFSQALSNNTRSTPPEEDHHTNDRDEISLVESAPPSSPPQSSPPTSRFSSSSLSPRTARPHARHRRQLFDGFRFSDLFRVFNSGTMNLKNIEDFSRAVRDDFVSSDIGPEEEIPVEDDVLAQPGIPAVQPGFQQPVFLPQQFPQFVTPGFQIVPQQIVPSIGQPGVQQFVQQPTQFVQQPAQQQFIQQPVQQFAQQPVQAFRQTPHHVAQHGGFPNGGSIKRMDETEHEPQREREDNSFFSGYRQFIRNSQREGGFLHRISNIFNSDRRRRNSPHPTRYHRKKREAQLASEAKTNRFSDEILKRRKRGVMDTIQRLWGGREFVGVLDRMMEGTDDSLYPYTRAALMGYTGSPETCEQLYPECPTSMDELINTFNNLRRYFPNGIPFRDRIPIPFRYLIP